MRVGLWCGLSIVAFVGTARATDICYDVGNDEAECITDQEFREQLDNFDDQSPDVEIHGDDIFMTLQRARELGGTDTILVDEEYRFHAVVLGEAIDGIRYKIEEHVREIVPSISSTVPTIPSITENVIDVPTLEHFHSFRRVDIYESGDNTDGQELYGRPGSWASWGCVGYPSIDSCKSCCMATRTTMLAPIYAYIKYCHGVWANLCGPMAWACHIACGVSEAAMLGVLVYSTNQCNDNCELSYWNDQSVDWAQYENSNPIKAGLDSGDYSECTGWLRHVEWAGAHWLGLVSDPRNPEPPYECLIFTRYDHDETLIDDPIVRELYWASFSDIAVTVAGEWPADFRPKDYRVVDILKREAGRQIPYVGVTGVDDDGTYIMLRQTDEKLYLRNSLILESAKIWVTGERDGNELNVRWKAYIWHDFLEGLM